MRQPARLAQTSLQRRRYKEMPMAGLIEGEAGLAQGNLGSIGR
jgi:hypothetical protein